MGEALVELPEYMGGSCQNARCDGSTKQRVLHMDELRRVYPDVSSYDWWPVPDGTTHVCTVCGFAYSGISELFSAQQSATPEPEPIDIDEWDWDVSEQFDMTVREAITVFVEAAPDDVSAPFIARAASRYLVGVNDEFAMDVMRSMDSYDGVSYTVDQFM